MKFFRFVQRLVVSANRYPQASSIPPVVDTSTWLDAVRATGLVPPVGFVYVPVPVSVQVLDAESYVPEYVTVPPSRVSAPVGTAEGDVGSEDFQRIARA
jgi:hypothetical protein